MRLARPELLWLLATLPVLGLFYFYSTRRRAQRWARGFDVRLKAQHFGERSAALMTLKTALWFVGAALCIVAATRPQYGASTVKQTRRGLDLVVAIDTSKSMLARDLPPDRLTRAKLELQSLLGQLRGDRVSFIAFSGQAFVQCPLTSDYAAAKVFLRAVDTRTIPRGGTAIGEAITLAGSLFEEAKKRGGSKSQVLIVLTDGEDHEGDPVVAAKALSEKGVTIYTVGIGSTVGEPIPVIDERGAFTGYLKDSRGATVLSRLNEDILRKIAQAGGGRYVASSGGSTGVESLLSDLAAFEREEHESRFKVVYADRYQWVLIPGLFFLLAAWGLPSSRRRGAKAFAAAAALTLFAAPAPAHALPWFRSQNAKVKAGNRALESGQADDALKHYEAAQEEVEDHPELWLDRGLALLKKKDAKGAKPLLERALLASDPVLRSRAQYLLGNAAFDEKDYEHAAEAYKKALREDPQNNDAKYNLELAQRLLKQQKDQEQQDKNKNQGKQDKDKKEQKKEGQRDQQGQEQKDQNQQEQKEQPSKPQEQKEQKDGQKPQPQEPQNTEPTPPPNQSKSGEHMQLLDALKAEEKPLQFNLFQTKKKKLRPVEKDW